MKLFQRAIALALTLVMVLAMVPAAIAADPMTVTIGSADLTKGGTVVLPITIANHDKSNPVGAINSMIKYDTENLKLTMITADYCDIDEDSEETGLLSAGSLVANAANGVIGWGDAKGIKKTSGTLCWLVFTTQDEVANGAYSIEMVAYNANTVFSDASSNEISDETVVFNKGTITVTGGVDKLNDNNTVLEGLKASYVYDDGNAIEPSFAVKYNGKTLSKGTDYTVSYENNTAVGTATVTVTGIGAYRGGTTATFAIVKKTGAITGTAAYTKTYGAADFTLDAAANSGAALCYVSDNTAVATVDAAGKVTVVGAGSAVITVSAAETENYTKPVDFKVNVTVGQAEQSLTATASYDKIYGDPAFDLNVGGAQGGLTYSSSKPSVAAVDANGTVTVVGVGTTTITVNAAEVSGKYNAASKEITVNVEQKEVSVSGITVADKVYDKTTAATVDRTAAVINGMVAGDDLAVEATGTFATATAGAGKTVNLTVSLTGAAAANYKLAADSQKTATATIEKSEIYVPTAKTGLVYNTQVQYGLEETADYLVSGGSASDAGDYTAVATLKDSINYKWADPSFDGNVAWSIAKADAEALTMDKTLRYSTTAEQTITAAEIAQKLDAPGEVIFADCSFGGDDVLGTKSFTEETVTYALADGLTSADAGKAAVITVVVSSDNYNDVELTVTVTVQDKIDVSEDIVFADGEAVYTGKVQEHETATYNGAADGITYTYSADPVNVGTYKVTATYEDADNFGTKTVDFRVKPASVTVTGATVQTKNYDGNTEAAVESVTFSGLVNNERFTAADYTVSNAAFADANVGTKKVTYSVELNSNAKTANYVLTGTVPAATGTITEKFISVSVMHIEDQVFSGNAITPVVSVDVDSAVAYILVNGTDYTVSYQNNTNVGTATVTVKAKAGSNYTFETAQTTFEITEAAAPAIADLAAEYTYNYTGKQTLSIAGIPVNAGTVTYEIGTLTGAAEMVSSVSAANSKVSFTVNAFGVDYVGKTVTIPVVIKMQNYADVQINVVITRIEKDMPVLAVQSIEKTYDGEELTAADIDGTATFEGEELEGTWEWVTEPAEMVNANEEGYTATVKFVPENTDVYMEVEAQITVVIYKATPSGQPSYTKIRNANKTLADADLEVGSITPEGTIAWAEDIDTVVVKGTKYQWIFTPEDTVNYNVLTGEILLYSAATGTTGHATSKEDDSDDEEIKSVIDRFVDVSRRDWYAEAVEMVVSEGLFEGVSAYEFAPNGTMTRAMLVTVLWRLAGEPAASATNGFEDVSSRAWYAEAVTWASRNGIVNGIDETTFAPNMNITREQMTVLLYRFAQDQGLNVRARADLSGYADASAISAYAEEAISWAVAEGLISGMTETTLAPKGTATRAQVATILMRFVNNIL